MPAAKHQGHLATPKKEQDPSYEASQSMGAVISRFSQQEGRLRKHSFLELGSHRIRDSSAYLYL